MDPVEVERWRRLELQQYLWLKLPSQPGLDHHEAAWALGDHLESVGRASYAALCRDRRTHEILAAWRRDPEEGARLATRAMASSGLLPPDTALLTFGEVMGRDELACFLGLSGVLERAIDAGELDPSARSFERDQVQVAESYLRRGALAAVRRERALAWALGLRGDPDWVERVLPTLEARSAVPENVELSLAPARALLERAVAGITLTDAGYLPPALVLELNDRFRWYDYVGRLPSREDDVGELTVLREHLTELRLLQARKGILGTTPKGMAALAYDAVFWDAVTSTSRWDEFAQEVVAVGAALLLSTPDVERQDLATDVTRLIRHRWKGGAAASDFERDVQWAYLDWYRVGFALGWWGASRGRWVDVLSPRGVAAAARAFWAVAGQPSRA